MRKNFSGIHRAESPLRQLTKKLRRGGKRDRQRADAIERCEESDRCRLAECPVCGATTCGSAASEKRGTARIETVLPTRSIAIASIEPIHNQRPIVEDELKIMVESIRVNGLRQPISVVQLDGRKYGLLDGAYRMNALSRLGQTEVTCVVEGDGTAAKLWNLAANLTRVDLTALDRALSMTAYVELLQASETDGQDVQRKRVHNDKGFSRVAKNLGWSREKIRRSKKISNLHPEAQAVARELGLDDNEDRLLKAAEFNDAEAQIACLRMPKATKPKRRKKDSPNDSAADPSNATEQERIGSPNFSYGKQSDNPTPAAPEGKEDVGISKAVSPAVPQTERVESLSPRDRVRDDTSIVPEAAATVFGTDIPPALIRLSPADQITADQFIVLWNELSERVRLYLRHHLLQQAVPSFAPNEQRVEAAPGVSL